MKVTHIFLLSIGFLITFTVAFGVGSFRREHIKSRNPLLTSSLEVVNKHVKKENDYNGIVSIIPILAYKQIVNGINFKIYSVVRENQDLKIVETVVYTGPFGSNDKPEILSNDDLKLIEPSLSSEKINILLELATSWTNTKEIGFYRLYVFQEGEETVYAGLIEWKKKPDLRPSLIIIIEKNSDLVVNYYEM